MKNYLSFGGGVNSVALHLLLLEQGVDFESVFVHHGTDWPETYDYVAGFQWWLRQNGHKPITILRPDIQGNTTLYNYCLNHQVIPSRMFKWCTDKFKTTPIYKYVETPCFMMIGFASDESGRAKLNYKNGVENRFPLIESEITRQGCKEIITAHGLPVPVKSGCYICYNQKPAQWKELRTNHPNLFCAAEKIEKNMNANRKIEGKKAIYICGKPLRAVIEEDQMVLFKQYEYPPCQCGL